MGMLNSKSPLFLIEKGALSDCNLKLLLLFPSFFLNFILISCTSISNCDDLKSEIENKVSILKKDNYLISLVEIDSNILKNKACYSKFEISELYLNISNKVFSIDSNTSISYKYLKKAVLNGYYNAVLLEFTTSQYIKQKNRILYDSLCHFSDSVYLSKYKNVNHELGYLLRFMVRQDQRIRIQHLNTTLKDSITLDSLMEKMVEIDYINEKILENIFIENGYPGYLLVGGEHNAASLIFHHMSLDFQFKYIHLLDKAVLNKQLFENINPIIDKILFGKYGITLYGTHYSNPKIETNKEIINKYRALLCLSLIP